MHHSENSSEVSPWYLSPLQKALVLEAKRYLFHFPLCIFGRIEGPLESQFPHWLNGDNNPYFEGSREDLVG